MSKVIDQVPLLDLNAQFESIEDEIRQAIDEVLDTQYFIMGDQVEAFENEIAGYCGAEHAVGCASGSDALLLSLMAMDLEEGDYVITSPYTFFATAGAIARVNAIPVFVDIDPVTYNIDPSEVRAVLEGEHSVSRRLDLEAGDCKAIIPVHLYGQCVDMDPIMELADEWDLTVIEDAAQAIGAEYRGKRAGSMGDFGCFSFFPSKNLGGFGDGGLVTTDNDEYAEKLRILRLHGAKPKYHHHVVGINSRLDTLQAAVLQVKLKYLDEWSERRREKALNYNQLFREKGLVDNGDIRLPREVEGAPEKSGRHIYHQYVIRTERRDSVMEALDEANIGHSIYYPVPLHEQECFSYLGYRAEDCPEAHKASRETLALPVYPELTDAQQEYVVQAVSRAF